jgi:hypothetical protein
VSLNEKPVPLRPHLSEQACRVEIPLRQKTAIVVEENYYGGLVCITVLVRKQGVLKDFSGCGEFLYSEAGYPILSIGFLVLQCVKACAGLVIRLAEALRRHSAGGRRGLGRRAPGCGSR